MLRESDIEGGPKKRIGVILAGGASQRMGEDKGAVVLAGRRLIDHVAERFAPQTDQLLVSGAHDYGSGWIAVADRQDGPRGPAAGLWAIAHWLGEHMPEVEGFVTVPIDGPFLPLDLYDKLVSASCCAIASADDGDHPTFAYWRIDQLLQELKSSSQEEGVSLCALAEKCKAVKVHFAEHHLLMNINTPEDLLQAEAIMYDVHK